MSLYHIFQLTSYIFQSYRLLLYDTSKLVVLTSPSAVCMIILLPHELVLLHASEPFLASYGFYRAIHFSAKRGIAIACRLSVRPSVRPSVCDVGEL